MASLNWQVRNRQNRYYMIEAIEIEAVDRFCNLGGMIDVKKMPKLQ